MNRRKIYNNLSILTKIIIECIFSAISRGTFPLLIQVLKYLRIIFPLTITRLRRNDIFESVLFLFVAK
jgi:hypothetical protein